MRALLIVGLTVLYQTQLTFSTAPGVSDADTKAVKCLCECDDWQTKGACECECKAPRTVCAPGYTKVCPEKDGKCLGETKAPLCPKDIFGMLKPATRSLDRWVQVKEVEDRSEWSVDVPARDPRKRERVKQTVKCPDIPKFKCDFIIDYTVSKVTSFKAGKCTHRKNFKKCPVEIETKDGCKIAAFLYNKQKEVYAKGKMSVDCPFTTTAPPTTTGSGTTTEAPVEMKPPVGDGCTCVPDFAMLMMAAGLPLAQARQEEVTEEPARESRIRGKVRQEVQCKGVPKFECDFIYDYEPCSRINTFKASKCNHRKDVKKCPIKLATKDGCEINTIITNKGKKMIASPTKTKISWGKEENFGFMQRCVCLPEMVDSVSV